MWVLGVVPVILSVVMIHMLLFFLYHLGDQLEKVAEFGPTANGLTHHVDNLAEMLVLLH